MSLKAELIRQIARLGPISMAEYMAQCLTHPRYGYYTTQRPIGKAGDFITAPEISQMFGELVGLWMAQAWIDQGKPAAFTLAELGPGTGQLMADVMRATRAVPGFAEAAQVTLVDINPDLKTAQARALDGHSPRWVDDVAALPDGPLFLIANEFFDCLPANQYVRTADGWQEKVVSATGDELSFARRPIGALSAKLPDDWPEGRVLELSPAATALATELAARIARDGGAVLIVDYGGTGPGGDTVQAVRGHAKVDVLAEPGYADLTAHVDFAALARASDSAQVFGPVPQGVFLEALGITQRARTLAQGLTGQALDDHIAAHHRLTHPDQMGDLFKVLACLPPDAASPPGFAV